ncbi:MAG: methyltransferase [Nitrosarchaeum sp.]|nr:methyltransferase [Nitrosarchaeum sp.]
MKDYTAAQELQVQEADMAGTGIRGASITSQQGLRKALQALATFEKARDDLEQYTTPAEIAAAMLWHAYIRGRIENQSVADLGAGCGILGIGALLLGAREVHFIDTDSAACALIRQNLCSLHLPVRDAEQEEGRFGQAQVHCSPVLAFRTPVTTVVQNPPFGTRSTGADVAFLAQACSVAQQAIYTLHKTTTLPYLRKTIAGFGWQVEEEQDLAYPLPAARDFHERKRHEIAVTWLTLVKDSKSF